VNLIKWSDKVCESTDEKPIHNCTNDQRETKKLQERNKDVFGWGFWRGGEGIFLIIHV
jgi:hypothetical protein